MGVSLESMYIFIYIIYTKVCVYRENESGSYSVTRYCVLYTTTTPVILFLKGFLPCRTSHREGEKLSVTKSTTPGKKIRDFPFSPENQNQNENENAEVNSSGSIFLFY